MNEWKGYLQGEDWRDTDNFQGLYSLLSQRLGMIRKLSQYCSQKNLKMLANGMFYSKLLYCLPLVVSTWNLEVYKDGVMRYTNFSKDDCHRLQVLQNSLCRLLLGYQGLYFKQSVSTEELLQRCGQLSIHQLGVFSTLVLVKKTLLTGCPAYFKEKLKLKQHQNSRGNEVLEPINARLNLTRSSFFYRGSKLYNMLTSKFTARAQIRKIRK